MREPSSGPVSLSHLVALIAMLATATGCTPSGDPLVDRAASTCREVMSQDPQFRLYAVTVAARNGSPFARELLREAMVGDDFNAAVEAARAIADGPVEQDREALKQVFSDKQGPLRLWAACGLARLGDAEARQWLTAQLDGVTGSARVAVLDLLASVGQREVVEAWLRSRVASEDQQERDEAYTVLGRIGEPWATQLLLKGLEKEHGAGRKEAIVALGRTGDGAVVSKLTPFVNTQGLVFATLEALGELRNPAARESLESMMRRKEPLVQVYASAALWKLGALDDPGAALEPLLEAGDPAARKEMAAQLARTGDPRAVRLLASLAADADPEVRTAAARALGELGDPGGVEALMGLTADADYRVSTAALGVLGRIALPDAAARLEPLLESDNPYVVLSAGLAILDLRARAASA